MENMLNAMQVAGLVGITVPTLNSWYKWKELNPQHELAIMLPAYEMVAHKRYWKRDSIDQLVEFKQKKPYGRNGLMGVVTQKYVKKEE